MFLGFFSEGVSATVEVGDVSTAWRVWSFAAEVSLLCALQLAGGSTPDKGFKCGPGVARFLAVALGRPVVGKARFDFLDPDDGQFVHLYRDKSMAGMIILRRQLRFVLQVLDGNARNGFSLSRSLELGAQLGPVLASLVLRGPCVGRVGLLILLWVFLSTVLVLARCSPDLVSFCMLLWSGAKMIPSAAGVIGFWRILWCMLTPGVNRIWFCLLHCFLVILVSPLVGVEFCLILLFDEQFRNAWLPYFCRAG